MHQGVRTHSIINELNPNSFFCNRDTIGLLMRKYYAVANRILPVNLTIDEINNQNAYCGLSLSNPNYYGKRLEAILKYLIKQFKKSILITSGYLYRYNYMLAGHDEKQSINLAIKEEKEYIDNQLMKYKSLIDDKRINLTTWFDYIGTDAFNQSLREINHFYNNNEIFSEKISYIASNYVDAKRSSQTIRVPTIDAINISKNFLLEEIVIFNIMLKRGYRVEIYPGVIMPVLDDIINGEFSDAPPQLKERISIELKVKKKGTKVS